MTVTRLQPTSIGQAVVSNHDKIMAALNRAVEDQKADEKLGQCSRGIVIVWMREYPDGSFGESFISAGLSAIEAVGLLTIAADDIGHDGLSGGTDHFPGGRPVFDEDEPA